MFSLALGPAATFILLMATLHGMMRDLISQSGMEPMLPAVETQSPNHWTPREVPHVSFSSLKPGTLAALQSG